MVYLNEIDVGWLCRCTITYDGDLDCMHDGWVQPCFVNHPSFHVLSLLSMDIF